MTAVTFLSQDCVRDLTDAIIDRARETEPEVGLTVIVGGEAADALRGDEEVSRTRSVATYLYRGAVVAVVSTLPSWLVMVVPVISALAPDLVSPASFYGDLRSNTFTQALPPRL